MPNLLLTAEPGLLGAELGNLEPGGPGAPRPAPFLPAGQTYPYIAHLFTQAGGFKKLLGKLNNYPSLGAQQNGGQASIQLELPAQDTSANAPVAGDLVKLTQQGGDSSILYTGIIEDLPTDLDVTILHAIDLVSLAAELDNTPVTANYVTPTDVAQMVRDAVGATDHLFVTPQSCPDAGVTGVAPFDQVTALSVIDMAKKIGGINFYYFVDPIGCVWFGQTNTIVLPVDAPLRSASNPVLTGAGWEGTTVAGPTVIYDAGVFKMWYQGGVYGAGAVGYATSADGVTWAKYAGNPVIAAQVHNAHVHKVGGTYHVFYTAYAGASSDLLHATSADGITWSAPHADLTFAGFPQLGFGNSSFLIDSTGTWYMLVEAHDGFAGTIVGIYLFSSPDGTTWTIQNSGNPLASLEVFSGGSVGGPSIYPSVVAGKFQLWYHACDAAGAQRGIYRATSTDLVNWTIKPPRPAMSHLGTGFESPGIGDPCVVGANGTSYLFYAGGDGAAGPGAIGVATVGKTLADWLGASGASPATYTIKRGVDFQSRKSTSPIAKLKNHIPVKGGIAAGTSAPMISLYRNLTSIAQYGTRALFPGPSYPTITDQATLDAIRDTIGAGLDRQITRIEFVLNNYPSRIDIKAGATLRFWEPDHNTQPESSTGTGTYSPTYVVLETLVTGPSQHIVVADCAASGLDDFKYEIDRIMARISIQDLTYVPASLNVMGAINGGGIATPGPAGTARWIIDDKSIRGEDGTSPWPRAEIGDLSPLGNSMGGWKFRGVDATGLPVFDSDGLIGVMASLADQAISATSVGTAGWGTWSSFGSAASFSLTRPARILVVANLAGNASGTNTYARVQVGIDGWLPPSNANAIFDKRDTGYHTSSIVLLSAMLAAGSHTAQLQATTEAATTLNVYGGNILVFLLGG